MKVVVVKTPVHNVNIDELYPKFLNSIRCENPETITETDIENSVAFKKTQAAINILDTLMALKYVDADNPNEVTKDTFDKYVTMANVIDSFFGNMVQDYMDKHEDCGTECTECDELAACGKCSLDCDIECGECEHCKDCCGEEFEDKCEDCEANECAMDAIKLVNVFKPAFNLDDVTVNDKEITITMTGREYLEIKEILDKYEFGEEDSDC